MFNRPVYENKCCFFFVWKNEFKLYFLHILSTFPCLENIWKIFLHVFLVIYVFLQLIKKNNLLIKFEWILGHFYWSEVVKYLVLTKTKNVYCSKKKLFSVYFFSKRKQFIFQDISLSAQHIYLLIFEINQRFLLWFNVILKKLLYNRVFLIHLPAVNVSNKLNIILISLGTHFYFIISLNK